ncbi:MAG: DUF4862 family protein [Elusimicrobia bacterium]|nr:DUF4862 family protein [Elusimicrobiota bacterium]
MKPFVSSYALSKPGSPWDRDGESALFEGLARLDLEGLELPYHGRLHAHDDGWLLDRLRPQWRFVLTLLPGTMERVKEDPRFGLASADADGRKRALDFADKARRTVEHLRRFLGRPAVAAVAVHSAPRLGAPGVRSSLEGFADSLTALRGEDWSGAELLVEHCDAAVAAHPGDKRFLRIEDECVAVKSSRGRTPARMLVNWGRSAVETRSAQGPLDHLRRCREAGLLAGLFFSGAAADDAEYGAWKDSHAPFSVSRPSSILTVAAAKDALKAAGDVSYLGLKIQPLPAEVGTRERLEMLSANLDALRSAAR